jgi:hypothetical protein
MEPSSLPAPPVGELVVLNGRQCGARRALTQPATFLGRAQGCDVRLNVEGVEAFHCVVVCRPGDVVLRDLNSTQGTFVNGQRVSSVVLKDGDLLDVGPFRFRVLLPLTTPAAAAASVRPDPEQNALRIQAAAVAAQQAQLDEAEARLEEHRQALEQREQQWAAQLNEQRQALVDSTKRHEAERASWGREKADLQEWVTQRTAELEHKRQEAVSALEAERARLQAEVQREWDNLRAETGKERDAIIAERDEARIAVQREREATRAERERARIETQREREATHAEREQARAAAEMEREATRAERTNAQAVSLEEREKARADADQELARASAEAQHERDQARAEAKRELDQAQAEVQDQREAAQAELTQLREQTCHDLERARQEASAQRQRDQAELHAARARLEAELAQLREQTCRDLERARQEAGAQRQRDLAELEATRAQVEAEVEELREQSRHFIEQARQQADAERQRENHEAKATLVKVEQRLTALERRKVEIQYEESELAVRRVQLNTERELDSRLLQDGLERLRHDQQRWRERRSREALALQVRRVLLIEGERKLAQARRLLVEELKAWQAQKHLLETELHGLNNRIVHQRQQLQEPAPSAPAGELTAQAIVPVRTAELDRLADVLADQRTQIVEHWERLVRAQHAWQEQRDEAAQGLQLLAEQLVQQEEALAGRAQSVETAEARARQWQEQLERQRQTAALAFARAQALEQSLQAEREVFFAETGPLRDRVQQQLDGLDQLRRDWNRRRQREMDGLRKQRRALDQLLKELKRARHDQDGQGEAITSDLDAMERLRQELADRAEQLAQVQLEWQERQTDLEYREALLESNQARIAQELQEKEQRCGHAERRLIALREETEQMARALLTDGEPQDEPLERAA